MDRPQRPQRPQRVQTPTTTTNKPKSSGEIKVQEQIQNVNGNSSLIQEEEIRNILFEKKKNRNKKIKIVLITLLCLIVASVGLYFITTGRISSKVTSLEADVADLEMELESTINTKDSRIAELLQAIEDTTVKELVPTTSLQRVEGSEVPELWLPEGDFIAANPLVIPFTSDGVNDSYVQIGQKFVFRPSDRWSLISQGATYEFGHPQKIWGKIRALSASDKVPAEEMQQIVQNFFVGYPATTISYRKVFIDDNIVGLIGKAKITVKYEVDKDVEIEVPVEMEVEVPYDVEEEIEVEVPYTETVTKEDGTTEEVEKTRIEKQKQTVTKMEKKVTTIMQKELQTEKTILEKDMVVNVGFVQRSDYAISFLFIYDSEGGSNSQELVDLLLKSGTFGVNGSALKLE